MKPTELEFIYETMLNQSEHMWYAIDPSYQIVFANQAFCKRWGTMESILGQNVIDFCFKGKKHTPANEYLSLAVKTIDQGKPFRNEQVYMVFSPDQPPEWFLVNTYLLEDENGKPKLALINIESVERFKHMEDQLHSLQLHTFHAFARAIGARDAYTMHHDEHVADLMFELANELNLPGDEAITAYFLGLIHDVGKIGIPEAILNKPGKLTASEFEKIKTHPAIGYQIIREIPNFNELATIVKYHHERYDGKGYPEGLGGKNIPLFSRMLAVCDSFDAMVSTRCYKDSMDKKDALQELLDCKGSQFDPKIAQTFINLITKEVTISN